MNTCCFCGSDIIFRYVQGKCVPIHLGGVWCEKYRGKYTDSQNNNSDAFQSEDMCRPTTCPECGGEVFFIRHNDGSVWIDELGWPWPKHACMESNKEPPWYLYFKRSEPASTDGALFTGRIVESYWKSRSEDEPAMIILAIDGGKLGRAVLATEATTTTDYLRGKMVIVNFQTRTITVSTYDKKPILVASVDPKTVGLPSGWATVVGKNCIDVHNE